MIEKILLTMFIVGGTVMLTGLISGPLLENTSVHWISLPLVVAGFVITLSIGPVILWELWFKTTEKKG